MCECRLFLGEVHPLPGLLAGVVYYVTGEVGCIIYSFICLYLLELQNDGPNALLPFYCTKHL